MDISPSHVAAREEAARLPALAASLALLNASPGPASIAFYGTAKPEPGGAAGGSAVVVIQLQQPAGTVVVDDEEYSIQVAAPIEGQITGAHPDDGTVVLWARITDGAGDWWGDCTVSDTDGDGDIRLLDTLLRNGAFARLMSGAFYG